MRATRELRFALATAALIAIALFVLLLVPRGEEAGPLPVPKPFPGSLDVLPNPASIANTGAQQRN